MKYFLVPLIMLFFTCSFSTRGFGQQNDAQRMERDIEVAENVLESLWKQVREDGNDFLVLAGSNPKFKGAYVEDYGLVFTSTRSSFGGIYNIQGKRFYAPQPPVRHYSRDKKPQENEEEEDPDEEYEIEDFEDDMSSQFHALAIEFLSDYSSLISQLKSNEKITLRMEMKSNFPIVVIDGRRPWPENPQRSYSATAIQQNMVAYRTQKISKEEFIDRIDFSTDEEAENKDPELELLASLMHRLYREDLSTSFRLKRKPAYEKLKDFGVIYHMDFSNDGLRGVLWSETDKTITLGKGSEMGRDEIRKNYERLVKDLPEQIVEYGRLLKKLQKDEMLVFKVRLPECKECDTPAELQFTVSGEVLSNYNGNRISLSDAVNKVKRKK